MTLKQLKFFFLIENPFFRVQITMQGKKKIFLCAKDDLLCAKAIFPLKLAPLFKQVFSSNLCGLKIKISKKNA